MLDSEFINIKNIMEISKIYDHSEYSYMFLKNCKYHPDIYIATRTLIEYFCELNHLNKYPKSSDLNDLIIFSEQNSNARQLKKYLSYLNGYEEKNHINQLSDTYQDHLHICNIGFREIRYRVQKFYEQHNLCDMSNIVAIYNHNKSDIYDIHAMTKTETFQIEKIYGKTLNCFKIKGVLFENITLSELINIINYSNCIDVLTLENVQVAYNFLR